MCQVEVGPTLNPSRCGGRPSVVSRNAEVKSEAADDVDYDEDEDADEAAADYDEEDDADEEEGSSVDPEEDEDDTLPWQDLVGPIIR